MLQKSCLSIDVIPLFISLVLCSAMEEESLLVKIILSLTSIFQHSATEEESLSNVILSLISLFIVCLTHLSVLVHGTEKLSLARLSVLVQCYREVIV